MPPRDTDSTPIPPSARKELTVKQQRDARRAEKVAALKKKQAAEKRNRIIAITLGSVAVVAVVGLVITTVVLNGSDRAPQAIGSGDGSSVEGVQTFEGLTANHVEGSVDYDQSPAVGGDHAGAWLNCATYSEPVPNENTVHSLEHGAVWVTYNPDSVNGDDIETLRASLPETYVTLSPFPDLQAPVVASAWGAQVELDGVDDPRLQQFLDAYWQSPNAPEPGAACSGGVDAPGKVA